MKGFMCHPAASTAVCTIGDSRSVIVPRKPNRSLTDIADDRRLKIVKYSRLVDSPLIRPNYTNRSSTSLNKEGTRNEKPKPVNNTPLSSTSDQAFQVVVMRVSIHCQGCAGKLKKHLSKMEGVTSFSIEVEAKRVTVRGNVSPIGVLESISKVKRAEFWPLPSSSSSSSS